MCEQYKFFTSPVEALDYFKNLVNQENPIYPDAILLDINMPQMTGWEFIEKYTALGISESSPIIMLTTSVYPKDLELAKEVSLVHQLINKPLEIDHLEMIKNQLL